MATVPPEAQPPALKEDEPFLPDGVDKADMLYDKCAQAPQGTVFFQRELSNMAVAANMAELAMLLQELVGKHLMKLMTFENEPCWKLRERAEAEKWVSLFHSRHSLTALFPDCED
jgi:DNA-directed RNA polymerase III subunit RPC6